MNDSKSIMMLLLGVCIGALGAVVYQHKAKVKNPADDQINKTIKKDCDKCVDKVEIEDINVDLAKGKFMCRCWKSKNWPYCDGAHAEHNKLTGDNVGPLAIVAKKK
jgi:hypothetical protein